MATFAQLAERNAFNGLTWHRIVPNFVLQGGSPGADEYDALTPTFMRDEVGFARNARGTFGISTRGRDTGDGQICTSISWTTSVSITTTPSSRPCCGDST